ncbi:putative L-threonine 3-dehydrogenase [Trypanosoma cruzi]|uniref:Putative L-threonine 3-dehydrogenase n=1 Tax=Trypanosoma cruzi TaxID=5693 RepID=A0A2V2X4R8_TRYCR|nr:putative L-threonine 3-dehydrogenase [Trypanosoma cruzi]
MDRDAYEKLVKDFKPTWLFHLPAIMSVRGEAEPQLAMNLNINSTRHALDLAREYKMRCFIPSTIAAFGDKCGKVNTKDDTILNPSTVYGVTKVFTEMIGTYYREKMGTDFRSVRFPASSLPRHSPVAAPRTTPFICTTAHCWAKSTSAPFAVMSRCRCCTCRMPSVVSSSSWRRPTAV